MEKSIIRYDLTLLNSILERDKAEIVEIPQKLNGEKTEIKFKCLCGEIYTKRMVFMLKKGGAFCKTCTIKNRGIKVKNTCIKKYGVDNPLKDKDIRNKLENTCLERYGFKNPLASCEIRKKVKKTMKKNYGVINPSNSEIIREKRVNTFIERFGVDNPLKNKDIKKKQDATIKNKYGVANISQLNEIQEKIQKTSRKYKNYTMPSGEIRRVQGYEPRALDELVKLYDEHIIKTDRKDVPRITYKNNDKASYYFPDIFISNENKIIEVKSVYTFNSNYDINILKKNATIEEGYNYEIWIYNPKTNEKTII